MRTLRVLLLNTFFRVQSNFRLPPSVTIDGGSKSQRGVNFGYQFGRINVNNCIDKLSTIDVNTFCVGYPSIWYTQRPRATSFINVSPGGTIQHILYGIIIQLVMWRSGKASVSPQSRSIYLGPHCLHPVCPAYMAFARRKCIPVYMYIQLMMHECISRSGKSVLVPCLAALEAFRNNNNNKKTPISRDIRILVRSETCEIIIGENSSDDGFAGPNLVSNTPKSSTCFDASVRDIDFNDSLSR